MKPAFTALAFPVAGLLALTATPAFAAPAPTLPTDTVVLRLPNKVVMTLVVQNAAQLRELKKYKLDSLTSRLASYIDQTEAAAQAGTADQVTRRFQPDRDHPGQQLPAEVRITARKPAPGQATGSTRTEADMERDKGGFVIDNRKRRKYGLYADGEGAITYRFPHRNRANDSVNGRRNLSQVHIGVVYDLGVNTFVNNSAASAGVPSLRHWATRNSGGTIGYYNIGLNYVRPLRRAGRARLALTVGPEFTFHNFTLTGNEQWAYNGRQTTVAQAPTNQDVHYSILNLTTLNVPVMLRFRLLDKQQDNKTLSAGIGGFVGYRLGNSLTTNYRLAGSDLKYEDEVKGPIGLNNWQYGVQGEIGFHGLRFFARYNLNELFEDGRGPQTHAFVAGIRLLGY